VQSAEWRPELLVGFFGGRKVLLTLDNCEHLIEACADLVDEVLSACPGVRVITTSQRALGLASESIFQVPPLSLPTRRRALRSRACPSTSRSRSSSSVRRPCSPGSS
jgi:predicted ATPase